MFLPSGSKTSRMIYFVIYINNLFSYLIQPEILFYFQIMQQISCHCCLFEKIDIFIWFFWGFSLKFLLEGYSKSLMWEVLTLQWWIGWGRIVFDWSFDCFDFNDYYFHAEDRQVLVFSFWIVFWLVRFSLSS